MLPPIIMPIFPKVLAPTETRLEPIVYLLYQERKRVWDVASSCQSLEVALVLDTSGMELEE
jgi:hypothetical protein